ncbi:hypothetical protein PR202_gb29315 [Eleusine coracana subsp. coracana]|uniref:Uncharacterized protein n=1 Tax=Eleusine coracana subsp. coracana TaxID=191504 RepID=A0AAV5G007_ELECO|nr:hypothetical protein PR202_gb29315 [Eleusine coracana subsp. coracana]
MSGVNKHDPGAMTDSQKLDFVVAQMTVVHTTIDNHTSQLTAMTTRLDGHAQRLARTEQWCMEHAASGGP